VPGIAVTSLGCVAPLVQKHVCQRPADLEGRAEDAGVVAIRTPKQARAMCRAPAMTR